LETLDEDYSSARITFQTEPWHRLAMLLQSISNTKAHPPDREWPEHWKKK